MYLYLVGVHYTQDIISITNAYHVAKSHYN